MELTNKKALPLALLQEIQQIRAKARQFAREKQEFIEYRDNNTIVFQLSDLENTSGFHFTVSDSRIVGNKAEIAHTIYFFPRNRFEIIEHKATVDTEQLFIMVDTWLNNLIEYTTIQLTEAEQIDNASAKEIYDLFDFIDDDAETATFNLKQQLYLDDALANVEATLEARKDEYEVTVIIQEVKALRKAIPNETKKSIGKKLSKIFVAAKKHGISLFKEVVKDFLKDAVKWGAEGGVHRLMEYLQ